MKLAKLSLAAIVAVGTMTSVASATPLEEAIKGVELNGMLRYRWYNESDEGQVPGGSASNRYRLSSSFGFTIPLADNFTAKVGLSANHSDNTKSATSSGKDLSYSTWHLKYATDAYNVTFGRMALNTPWTDPGFGGSKGTGVLGMYTGLEGWAFAAAVFNSTDNASGEGTYLADDIKDKFDNRDLYVAAAIGSVGPVNLQVWGAKMTDFFDSSVFAQADVAYEGFTFKVQANQLELAKSADAALGLKDDKGLFWGVEAGFGMNGFKVGAGYTQNDDEMPIYTLNADDAGMIKAGKQIYYETTNALDAETMFINAGYSFDKYRVGAGYVDASIKEGVGDTKDYDKDETYFDLGYKYSKKLDFSAYYSIYEGDDADDENNELRFQAMYKF
jgi:hypothetical protein